jgi:hypothetical protein
MPARVKRACKNIGLSKDFPLAGDWEETAPVDFSAVAKPAQSE